MLRQYAGTAVDVGDSTLIAEITKALGIYGQPGCDRQANRFIREYFKDVVVMNGKFEVPNAL